MPDTRIWARNLFSQLTQLFLVPRTSTQRHDSPTVTEKFATYFAITTMKEEDILARQSRPQKHSTWVPKSRDWRYATGVFQHDDNETAPNDRSAWDDMDYDYQVADPGKSRSRSGSGQSYGDIKAVDVSAPVSATPKSAKKRALSDIPKATVKIRAFKRKSKSKTPKKNVWMSVARRQRISHDDVEGEEPDYQTYSLTVRLRFSGRLIIEDALPAVSTPGPMHLQQIPDTPANFSMPFDPHTPATARTAASLYTPHMSHSGESVHTYPPFQRPWVDETKDFNMRAVRSVLQKPGFVGKDLGVHYTWYNDAVPVDALLPPGVPLSAKEVMAYYPHHVRWKSMMVRLANNDYRGADIVGMQAFFRGPPTTDITAAVMNQFQRDSVKKIIEGFKTDTINGKHDANLHTDHLEPGRYIADRRSGYVLPTFSDLLGGLNHLPSGLDARGLTECLSWYLHVRDSFTPKLELNVLHTQALIRALRIPLKRYGPQNLDCNALKEWKEKGRFEERKVYYEPARFTSTGTGDEAQKRSRLYMNLDNHEVKLDYQLQLRHVLTVPFLALHSVMGEALKLGIEKAENRMTERVTAEGKKMLEAKWAARVAEDVEPEEQLRNVEAQQLQAMIEKPGPIDRAEDSAEKSHPVPRTSLTAEALRTLAPAPRRTSVSQPPNGGPLGYRVAGSSTQALGRQSHGTPEPMYLDRAWGVERSVVDGEIIVVDHIVQEIGKGDTLLADEGWDEDDVVT
ncbi:uncharacterized protein J4E88_002715 [Alternaria novae-zelandiae]|uniref:uncharacterized protein n=1 Tax=Alternaria novae-zelandiae TaxID=430562 RepID=UPI0020C516AC|nr:uncharacterized protein J4E88_002715 [Alternaria novae-zelandiae]KAI4689363.1 hypothetical protein J4E88_002715 [Alternaria novae-zelandiae]